MRPFTFGPSSPPSAERPFSFGPPSIPIVGATAPAPPSMGPPWAFLMVPLGAAAGAYLADQATKGSPEHKQAMPFGMIGGLLVGLTAFWHLESSKSA